MTAVLHDLRAEYRSDALGLGASRPRLSWRVVAPAGADQVAYELALEGGATTGRVSSADRVLVDWPFAPLDSRQAVVVRARAWMGNGTVTPWSAPLAIEAGLLEPSDWSEPFVSPSTSAPAGETRPGYLLRAPFGIEGRVLRARLHATAHGLAVLSLNGAPVAADLLTPGWTSYRHRLRVRTYDATPLLRNGANVLGAQLADGWYRGRIGFNGGVWDLYGRDVALLAQLEVTRPDGTVEVVPLADAWRWTEGPVLAAGLYEGETFDGRRRPDGWDAPGFDASGWRTPALLPGTDFPAVLEPAIGVPVRSVEELDPVAVERRPDGRIRLDFGQNIAGRLAVRVQGPAGTTVRLHHAEVLEGDDLGVRPLRTAASVDTYVLRGQGVEEWSPSFTVHGFRYAELEGWPGDLEPGAVRARVVHSDMHRIGWFSAGDPLLDRLHENVVWGMRGNFVDLPTDCPQRDERLGWTGDIEVFAPTASFLYDSAGTLVSWLRDLAAEQGPDGAVPNFVPWIPCGFPEQSAAAWGDAAVIVPWTLYQRFGDVGVLEAQWNSMRAWVDHSAAKADASGLITSGVELGDWLDPAAPPDDPAGARTDRWLVASAYLAWSAHLTALAAGVLGETDAEERYRALADRTRKAFRAVFVHGDRRVDLETPTALSLAIAFELLEPAERADAGRRLAALLHAGGDVIQTGFVGTPIVCDALASTGQAEAAYALLLQRDCPSWLYQVTMGATTVWERWDSMLPDGSINPGEMTSFNHYALGAVADFLHRRVAGLAPAAPGYRRLHVEPLPGGGLERAAARLITPYGEASSSWRIEGDRFLLDVVVPTGSTATVVLPGGATPQEVGSGAHRFEAPLRAAGG